ncbi:MAG: lyase family protein [Candidatus Woesearchaeota archaeon]|nr:lyase family protein [Candidatus Woesearchaeota archaeon]
MKEERTQPKPRFPKDYKVDTTKLAAGRYGTFEMVDIWGDEKTFEYSLYVQGEAARTLAKLYPDIVSVDLAEEIAEKASLRHIDPDRIRELEEKGSHDVIAINTSLEEKVSPEAGSHINKAKTSADTTQPARAIQLKLSLCVIADSVENLRDILIDKSSLWIDKPHMDETHGYDALPTVAGRPFAHYAEMLQSGLDVLRFVYEHSVIGKWGDATGNHHSALALGIDGIKLQEEYCKKLGIGFMDAATQLPGLEFEADIAYVMSRLGETMNNIAKYIAWGRSDDVNIFINAAPQKKKGSSAMPHKDAKNGNPTEEEQFMSARNYLAGNLVTALMNCEMPYARNLAASANSRINLEDGFKFTDHAIRRLANIAYWIELREERAKERVLRSYGIVTAQLVMTYLTDHRKVKDPLTRNQAHDLMGELATCAWNSRTAFIDVLLTNEQVTGRLNETTLREITDPLKYIGQSKEIVRLIADKYHHKKTL